MFEDLALEYPDQYPRSGWVEQVDYRIPGQPFIKTARASAVKRKHLPSLDEITARLSLSSAPANTESKPRVSARLPAFLNNEAKTPVSPKPRRALPAAVGRLQFPSRTPSPPTPVMEKLNSAVPPPSPSAITGPKLQIVTSVVPNISSKSPTAFTEDNLKALASQSRERTARDMLTRLRRRTTVYHTDSAVSVVGSTPDDRKLRRRSAPPELPLRERRGFTQPKLNLPGAF